MHSAIFARVGGLLAVALLCISSPAWGQSPSDGDKVEGAVWKYDMSRVDAPAKDRAGRFRIAGTDIYQPRKKSKGPMKVGTITGKMGKPEKGDEVTVDFTRLRAADDSVLKCHGTIVWDEFGEVHGRLVDSEGVHWNFRASRVQE